MSRIFLSHSSENNPRAFAVASWLRENGWEDVFLDTIPKQGIAAGEDWKAKLHECMNASVAGIFLISEDWINSHWCQTELTLAYSLNKLIFGVIVDDLPKDQIPPLLKSNWQIVDLHTGRDHILFKIEQPGKTSTHATLSQSGLLSLKEGLQRAEISPEYFVWPPKGTTDPRPWRGLSPMEVEDAGIFFGRDGQITRALELIRSQREDKLPGLIAIVGASGAGKSSFLRAGLIPRLKRDSRNYLTLDVFRPGNDALDAFASRLCSAASQMATPKTLAKIRRIVYDAAAGSFNELFAFLTDLTEAHRLPEFGEQELPAPTLVLAIDQGEEFFHPIGRSQGSQFLSLLSILVKHRFPKIIALLTIRSDSYETLQNSSELSDLPHSTFGLSAILKGEYGRIITGPIEKLKASGHQLEFDQVITDTLLAKLDEGLGRDALPLLAFTLDRLYRDYHTSGKITLNDYNEMNGIAGSINAAVESAIQSVMKDQRPPINRRDVEKLLRRTIVPWFAGIDPATGAARRNICRREQLPTESLPLVDALIAQRLLTSDGVTIEPAHEALLREWELLSGWLVEDHERLITLEALRHAAADWKSNGQHKDYLAHKTARLEEAERLVERQDLWQQLTRTEFNYLSACRESANQHSKYRRIIAAAFVLSVGIGLVATGYQARLASEQASQAAQSRADAVALLALSQAKSNPINALKLVLGIWPPSPNDTFPTQSIAVKAISIALAHTRPHKVLYGHKGKVNSVAYSPDGQLIVSGGQDGTIRLWNANTGEHVGEPILGHQKGVTSVAFSSNGRLIVSGGGDGFIRMWDSTTALAITPPLHGHALEVLSVAFSHDGNYIVSGGGDRMVRLWDVATGKAMGNPMFHGYVVLSVAVSPDNSRIISGGFNSSLRVWSPHTHSAIGEPIHGHMYFVRSVVFTPDGNRFVSAGEDKTIRVWDTKTHRPIFHPLRLHQEGIFSVAVSADNQTIVSGSEDGTIRLANMAFGTASSSAIRGHEGAILSVAFSSNGRDVVSSGSDSTIRIWNIKPDIASYSVHWDTENSDSVDILKFGGNVFNGSFNNALQKWSDLLEVNILQVACDHIPQVIEGNGATLLNHEREIGIGSQQFPEICNNINPPLKSD